MQRIVDPILTKKLRTKFPTGEAGSYQTGPYENSTMLIKSWFVQLNKGFEETSKDFSTREEAEKYIDELPKIQNL